MFRKANPILPVDIDFENLPKNAGGLTRSPSISPRDISPPSVPDLVLDCELWNHIMNYYIILYEALYSMLSYEFGTENQSPSHCETVSKKSMSSCQDANVVYRLQDVLEKPGVYFGKSFIPGRCSGKFSFMTFTSTDSTNSSFDISLMLESSARSSMWGAAKISSSYSHFLSITSALTASRNRSATLPTKRA